MIVEVQAALFSKIDSIVGLGAEVFEQYAPQDTASYPYVVIQPISTVDNSTDLEINCFIASFQVHVWSKQKSSIETSTIQKKIYDELHRQDLTVTGYGVSIVVQESATIDLDSDGITRHGIQIYDIIFESTL